MNYFSFNPFGNKSLYLEFECDSCNEVVRSENIFIPTPNYAADTSSESQVEEEGFACCQKCSKEFEINIYVTYAGGDGNIENLEKETEVVVHEIPDPTEYELDAILSNTDFYDNLENELNKINDLNELNITSEEDENTNRDFFVQDYGMILPDDLVFTIRNLLYTNVITCLETYLSSAYINTVLSKPKYTKKFYETFLDFQKEKITLSQLFDLKDKVEEIAKKAMYKVIYHNLEKVKPMFKDTFNIDFPNFSEIAKAIEIRHDIVHRNGRTKENVTIEISKDDISKLIVEVKEFVKKIDEQIHKL